MPVLSVRISDKEKALLTRRWISEGVTAPVLVRRMIQEKFSTTGGDILDVLDQRFSETRLRIHRKK